MSTKGQNTYSVEERRVKNKLKRDRKKEKKREEKLKILNQPSHNSNQLKKLAKSGLVSSRQLLSKKSIQKASPVKNHAAELVARALSIPLDSAPVRYAGGFTTAETAIASPWSVLDYPWDTTNTTQQLTSFLKPGDLYASAFRHPVCNSIHFDPNVSNQEWNYTMRFATRVGAVDWGATTTYSLSEEGFVDFLDAIAELDYQPHGPTLYPAYDAQGRSYIWIDGCTLAGNTTKLTFIPLASTSGKIDVYRYGEEQPTYSMPFSGLITQLDQVIADPGYYRLDVVSTTGAIAGIKIEIRGTCGVFCHLPAPDLIRNFLSVKAVRTNAVSLMYSNMAAQIQLSGQIAMYQAPEGSCWTTYALDSKGPYTKISTSQGSERIVAKNGMYGFLKPTQMRDFDYCKDVTQYPGGIVKARFPIVQTSAFLAMGASIELPGGRQGYLTISNGLEYETSDTWRPVQSPTLKKEDFEAGSEALARLVQFHENPKHLAELWEQIKNAVPKVAQGILKYAPYVMQMAERFA